MFGRRAFLCVAVAMTALTFHVSAQQTSSSESLVDEIPLEKCDRLPVVRVKIGKKDMRFLVDSGATTILNLKSFGGAETGQIKISSWKGEAATSASEVTLPVLSLGSHQVRNLKLPAIDLSPIGKACGGQIDGLFGVELMERMGIRIDFERRLASFKPRPDDAKRAYDEMKAAMLPCSGAFEQGDAKFLEECFDPEIVLYTPHGRFKGRQEAMQYMRQRYFQYAPNLTYNTSLHDAKIIGDALWYSYDFTIGTPKERIVGQGISMCRKNQGHWQILNMHHSFLSRVATAESPQ